MNFLNKIFNNKSKYEKSLLAINIAIWKRELFNTLYKEYNIIYVPLKDDIFKFKNIIQQSDTTEILIWGYKECVNVEKFATKFNLNITRVEDGFIRGQGLGIEHKLPCSICFDKSGLYYNASQSSDFEQLAQNHKKSIPNNILELAKEYREIIIKNGISKYNLTNNVSYTYPQKIKNERILVIGQCEQDSSIKYSLSEITTNLNLLKFVKQQNPQAEIVFKQHPDEIFKNVSISEINNWADIVINKNVGLNDLFKSIDKVYTISSLMGFEALIRNLPVYTVGLPFYAGWGLTIDALTTNRRTEKLTIDEIFALTYLIYPTYLDNTFEKIPSTTFISNLVETIKDDANYSSVINKTKKTSITPLAKPKAEKNKEKNILTKPSKNVKKLIDSPKNDVLEAKIQDNIMNAIIDKTAPKIKQNAIENTKVSVNDNSHDDKFPEYLNIRDSYEITEAIHTNKPLFFYVPWIFSHTDILIKQLYSSKYQLIALNLINNSDSNYRKQLSLFSTTNPILYKKYIRSRLIPLKQHMQGLIVTFDWAPITRIIVEVCKELEIYTILIPHESVFLNSESYYLNPITHASVPICDEILAWGNIQKNIFTNRGYQEDHIKIVGSPKLDNCINYTNVISKELFCSYYGLNPNKKIILFASQNLDIQIDSKLAQTIQNQTILDILEYCEQNECQFIIRMPPSTANVLFTSTLREIHKHEFAVIDYAPLYITSPNESIYHSDIVISLNSTMLFEAVLMKKKTLSIRYTDQIKSIWDESLVPVAKNKNETINFLNTILTSELYISDEGVAELKRLSSEFGIGRFDGQSSKRIVNRLETILNNNSKLTQINYKNELLSNKKLDVLKICSSVDTLNTTQKYIQKLLNCNTLLNVKNILEKEQSAIQFFIQWGIQPSNNKENQKNTAKKFGKDVIYIEDGFIRSSNIGLSGEPGLSIIIDDKSAYYDATSETRLEQILNSNFSLSTDMYTYAQETIKMIVENKVSKYNSAPLRNYKIGRVNKKKLLLIDQRYNDFSVIKGMGSEASFDQMLTDAINNYPDYDIIIKQHPDALLGGKTSYFNNDKLKFTDSTDNIFIINIDMNPYCLLSQIDEVFVCSSGMGFEALMVGKPVTCYGMPWYAGYGATTDKLTISRRTQKRSLEELFYVSYIHLSRYYNPINDQQCPIENTIQYIIDKRQKLME